jgi:DNA-binding CsgD family transcriptional regulator/GAF domain-containing protein
MTYPLSIAEACYGSLAERVRAACLWPGSGILDAERRYLSLHDDLMALTVQIADSQPGRDREAHERRVGRLLGGITARKRELHVALAELRTHRLARVNESMAWFGAADSPAELAAKAPAVLCSAGEFDRVMMSRVDGSTWIPASVHIAAGAGHEVNAGLLSRLPGIRIPLTSLLIETHVLRHREPALVDAALNGRTDGQLGELSRSRAYVVAPIVVADRVAGFLHADTYTSRRTLTLADKASVQAFADLFGLLYERAVMTQRLRDQQAAVADVMSGALAGAGAAATGVGHLTRPEPPAGSHGRAAEDARLSVGRGGLTSREWEILRLLATGATNSQIASALIVSESTVKSHVKRILHKLPAANRAEAVYRYTKLAGEVSRAS